MQIVIFGPGFGGNVEKIETIERPELGWLQTVIGGYVELVRGKHDGHEYYCNEEGRLLDLPLNMTASQLAGVELRGVVVRYKGAPCG